ncbi:MAG TPA: AbrB/MazE/SpoVT family DNA-binding domain-containing protein [Rhizobiales bacterium]|nr:AbrB/MazE/SpoVT family DNA-binding domain-containing protein [Hyphomicrobiales bacterium]
MRVTSKGQVTIPRDLRESFGIGPNGEGVFAVEGGKITVAPRGGRRDRVLPDFFVGAHATIRGYPILTGDRDGYRAHFPGVEPIAPESHP